MTCHKAFAYHGSNTPLIYDLQHAHLIHALKKTFLHVFIHFYHAAKCKRGLAMRILLLMPLLLKFVKIRDFPEFLKDTGIPA